MLKEYFNLKHAPFIMLYLSCYLAASAYGFIYILSLLVIKLGGDTTQVGGFLSMAGLVTLLVVGFSGYLARKFSPSHICALGMLLCCIGFCLLVKMTHLGSAFYSAGVFLGAGWSLYYASSPMIINLVVTDHERGKHLSWMAAFVVLGTATGPILSSTLIKNGFSLESLYHLPIILSLISAILFLLQAKNWNATLNREPTNKLELKKSFYFFRIMSSEAKYPLMMVFLGACILTSMLNFQILYAQRHGLNYSLYYFAYMAAVVLSRFLFGGILTKKNPLSATPLLLMLMIAGLVLMIYNTDNPILYALSAIALGISYGLVYPLIKTYAINVTPKNQRHEVLAYFTLFYFLGVYGFPWIGSLIIKNQGFSQFLVFLIGIVMLDFLIGLTRSKNYLLLQANYESQSI